jgi:hypothetical protein
VNIFPVKGNFLAPPDDPLVQPLDALDGRNQMIAVAPFASRR